jgi:hypothetical protein
MDAIQQMAAVTSSDDMGVIYYVGHGQLSYSNNDVVLSVYDRTVERDEGIRVSDILGILQSGKYRGTIDQIPHFLIVIDACGSGNAALGGKTVIDKRIGHAQMLTALTAY